jgi:hypothetical protein
MSQYLETLKVGSTLELEGPMGLIEYTGRGEWYSPQRAPRVQTGRSLVTDQRARTTGCAVLPWAGRSMGSASTSG